MNPIISLLNNHDVEIRQKTQPASIPHSVIADLLDAMALRIEKDVPYQLGIPFDSMVSSMTGKQLTTNDKYFVSQVGSIPGGGCMLALAGDGVHAPDLSNFFLVNGAYNIGVGVVNQLIFYYDASSNNYCVSILQLPAGATITAVDNGPDTTPPVVASIAVMNANPSQVVITYNEALKTTTVPAPGNFVVTAGGSTATINSVAVSSNTVLLNLASPIIAGSSNFIQYTPGTNKIQDLAGNLAAAIPVNTLITNNVGTGGGTATQLNAPTGLTATAASPSQINLVWTDTNSSPNESGSKIYRNTVNTFSSATQIGTAAANATAYNDTAVPAPSTLYYYWVVASGDGTTTSNSAASASASATSGAASSFLTINTATNVTDTAHVMTGTGGAGAFGSTVLYAQKLPSGVDGVAYFQIAAADSGQFMIGVNNTNVQEGYAAMAFALFCDNAGNLSNYGTAMASGSMGAYGSFSSFPNNYIGIRRSGSTWDVVRSTDAVTWTRIALITGMSSYTGDIFIKGDFEGGGKMYYGKGLNVV